jgi:hypothetical protein
MTRTNRIICRFLVALFIALGVTAAGAGIASAGDDPGMTHDSVDMTHN